MPKLKQKQSITDIGTTQDNAYRNSILKNDQTGFFFATD